MSLKKLSFEEALELESESLITIYDLSPDLSDADYYPSAEQWIRNYTEVRYKFRQFNPAQVTSMLNCNYRIELELPYEPETNTFTWKVLYAKTIDDLKKFEQYHSKGRFVYVLTNEAYPGFVKIGKAVNPVRRVEQINGAGVVSEWKLRYSLPVENDYIIENSVHKYLAEFRRGTDQGSSREFFQVTLEHAIEVIEMLAKEVRRGDATYY
jgi:hypothetical protein